MTTMATARRRRHLLIAAAFAAAVAACDKGADAPAAVPRPVEASTACDLDGMLLADYPGPKAQLHYADGAAPVFFCDTVELFATLHRPEQVRKVAAAFVQDMARTDWDRPEGYWIDAMSAFYVVGSKRHGSMGPTFASFSAQSAAQRFAEAHGGRVLPYADVKPEMADVGGGAKHDSKM